MTTRTGNRARQWFAPIALAMLSACASPPTPQPNLMLSQFVTDRLAGPPVLLHGTGAAATYKIVVLGDGFTEDPASIGAYRTAVDAMVAELLSVDPFQALASALSIYRVDVVSDEAGIDVPVTCGTSYFDPATPSSTARFPRDVANALDTHWCAEVEADDGVNKLFKKGFLDSDTGRVPEFALASGVTPDATVVLVNDWKFGATAWPGPSRGTVFASIQQNLIGDLHPDSGDLQPDPPPPTTAQPFPVLFPGVVVHELGHLTPFDLLDEYGGETTGVLPASKVLDVDKSPNLTTALPPVLAPLKWAALVPSGTTLPHDCTAPVPPDAGAVPGGEEYHHGVFHPACHCRMRTLEQGSFCVVCRGQIFTELASRNLRTDLWTPRARPRGIRVILDSVHLRRGVPGSYSMPFRITVGDERIEGRWPDARGRQMQPGPPLVVGDMLTPETGRVGPSILGPPLASSARGSRSVRIEYAILRSQVGVPERVVARDAVDLTLDETGIAFVPVGSEAHRLIFGIIAR